jgi:cyanophycinase
MTGFRLPDRDVEDRLTGMSVYLIGGGWSDEHAPAVFGPFLAECGKKADRSSPKVRLVVMGTDQESLEYHERYVATLALAGDHELLITRVPFGEACPADALEDIDGLLVGGGPTPEYHQALSPLYSRIGDLVTGGLPYAGFSAGAALAASTAIIGGWRVDHVTVCPEETNEDLEPVTVVPGIGLVEGAVDVHAAQWGTLGRLMAAVDAQLVDGGVAIDECTMLMVDGSHRALVGAGRVWQVSPAAEGVGVTTLVPQ